MVDMLIGIDASHWDPTLDWKQYDWDFAFIKALEGMTEDPNFQEQWAAANGRTIRGAYDWFHYFNDQRRSVEKLLSILGDDRGELPPVLDLEDHDGQPDIVAPKALEWLREADRKFGRKPIVYISLGFALDIHLEDYPEFAEYPLWLAQYPWDKITSVWTEEKRIAQIDKIIHQRELYVVPNAIRPWSGKPSVIQWTGKCPPEFVPGYPIHDKKAVDINFYPGSMKQFFEQFKITYTPKGDDGMDKPITMTAELIAGTESRFRNGPGLGFTVYRILVGPLTIKGTGTKVLRDGYYWIEVVAINDQSVTGWVALTTSYTNIIWTEPNPVAKKIVKQVAHFDDGSTFETFPR